MTASATPAPPRPRARRVLVALAAVVVVVGLLWVGIRTAIAAGELRAAEPLATSAGSALQKGNVDAAVAALDEVSARSSRAADLTSDPVYRAAEVIPLLGPNLTAIRESAAALDDVVTRGVTPLAPLAAGLSGGALTPADGRIDLASLTDAAPTLARSAGVVAEASESVGAIDTSATLGVVTDAVSRLGGIVRQADATLTAVSNAAELLPLMLGGSEDRNYVLVFQNNAELRASGGLPGALALVTTSGGGFDLTVQTTANDFPLYDQPVIALDGPTTSLYGGLIGQRMQNVNSTPDFPTTGAIISEMWARQFGTRVDGVIAVDPVALGYLLDAAGAITLSTGDVVDSANAASFLLSGVYAKYPDTTDQDLVFAETATAVFSTLSSGAVDPARLLGSLARASDERRILIWNVRPEEQAVLAGTTFAGTLPTSDAGGTSVGIYLNDATGAKMDYYLEGAFEAGVVSCESGVTTTGVSVRLDSNAPADAATSLPAYVTAQGAYGVAAGSIRTRVVVYGPLDSTAVTTSVDGVPTAAQFVEHLGRPAVQLIVDLAPGEGTTISLEFQGGTDAATPVLLQSTPLVRPAAQKILSPRC